LVSDDPRAGRIRRDAALLARADATLGRAAAVAGRFEIPLRSPGFATLAWLILGQQVSIEAADAMFARLETTLGRVTPGGLLGLDDETLRRCGFSRQKAGYSRDLAQALLAGEFSLEAVEALPDEAAVAALTGRRGIGVWTAENYLIWGLGRRDIFPCGDLALRLGWQGLAGEGALPSPEALSRVAEAWSPRRTAAAFLIWHHYLRTRGRG
jgi:DNA-3-methyladenine glycosylase II